MIILTLAMALWQVDPAPPPDVPPPQESLILRDLGFSARIGWWFPNINGRFESDEHFSPLGDGSTMSIDGDLDIDDEDVFPFIELSRLATYRTASGEIEMDQFLL